MNILLLAENIPYHHVLHLALLQNNTKYAKREVLEDQKLMTETIQSVYDLGIEAIQTSRVPLDLLILPESAIPFLGTLASNNPKSTYSKSFVDITQNLVQLGNMPVAFNELVFDGGSRNSFTLIQPISLRTERKYKHHLLPFGEYLPGEKYLPIIRKLFPESSNHIPGEKTEAHRFRTQADLFVSFAPFICYEILYPEWIRELVIHSPSEFMINLTNDSWFESRTEAEQHAGAGRLRSIEMGRPLVRVALTGLTIAYDPWGREMMEEVPIDTKSISYLDLPTVSKTATTPYLLWGPYPWRLLAILLLIVVILQSPKTKNSSF